MAYSMLHSHCCTLPCPPHTMQYLLVSGAGQLALEMVLAQDSSSSPDPESTVKSSAWGMWQQPQLQVEQSADLAGDMICKSQAAADV